MEFLATALLYIGVISAALLVLGLCWPWALLWWEAVQNRRKVISVYGSISIAALALSWFVKQIENV
jgi:hypothetical protein